MRRVGDALGPGRMRVLGGVGALVACGVAGVTVAASPKPADAPLKPPVDPGAPLNGNNVQAAASATPGLVIPATPVCAGGTKAPAANPSLQPILDQLRVATTRAQRLAILQGLTADQRQQVTAMLRMRAGAAQCSNPQASSTSSPQQPMIEPDVVAGAATPAPITTTYVS